MIKKLSFTHGGLIALSLFALGLFFLWDPLADADEQIEALAGLPGSGMLAAKSDGIVASGVDPHNNLYVFWKEKGTHSIYYNYYNGTNWSQAIPVMDYSGNPIVTNYGMEVVFTVDVGGRPTVCLFYKPTWDHESGGLIDFTCSPVEYDAQLKPVFTFEPTREFVKMSGVVGMVQATPAAKDSPTIYFAWSEPNSATSSSLRAFTCKLVQGFRLDCEDYITPHNNMRGDRTALALVNGTPYIFYADTYNAEVTNYIYYFPTTTETSTRLENNSGNPRKTIKQIETLQVSDLVYVAFANPELTSGAGHAIQFASAPINDLKTANENNYYGNKKWTYCKLQTELDGSPLAYSKQPPTLVEYNDGVYLFYTGSNNDDTIMYLRIDTLEGNGVC
ncbi:MAG TPA: hypothetical protein VI522_01570 [Gammaproteobacteria bacterium]|nr:hypothetical protein [Gammaproteobacteria bacterium]